MSLSTLADVATKQRTVCIFYFVFSVFCFQKGFFIQLNGVQHYGKYLSWCCALMKGIKRSAHRFITHCYRHCLLVVIFFFPDHNIHSYLTRMDFGPYGKRHEYSFVCTVFSNIMHYDSQYQMCNASVSVHNGLKI